MIVSTCTVPTTGQSAVLCSPMWISAFGPFSPVVFQMTPTTKETMARTRAPLLTFFSVIGS